ncbi:MAG: alcohol dehydrogenase catalytic domain-containing protein [Actinomycetota bacterium]
MEIEGYRLHHWGQAPRWEAFSLPDPGRGEVLIQVEACGVGLTVLNCMNGALGDDPDLLPLTPGHEAVGRIAAVGEGVDSKVIGNRVMAYFYLSCFRCRWCLEGRESRCENLRGWYGVHRDGGYAPFSVLPEGNTLALPEGIPAAQATVIPDAVATPVHVCRTRLGIGPGDRVAVIGAGGGVGIHMVQVAAACGANVMGLERGDEKLALVEGFGVTAEDSSDFDAVALEDFDGRADAIIDLLGTRESLSWSLSRLATGGSICILTTFRGVEIPVQPREFVFREMSIVGSRYASRSELLQAAEMVERGEVRPVVGVSSGPREVESIHELLRTGRLEGRGAILWDSQ